MYEHANDRIADSSRETVPGIEAALEREEAHETIRGGRLARAFPSLAGLDGVSPFDTERLERAAITGGVSLQAWHAVRFILGAIRTERTSRVGRFDYWQAWDAWDLAHKQAFLASASESTLPDIREDFEHRNRTRDGW